MCLKNFNEKPKKNINHKKFAAKIKKRHLKKHSFYLDFFCQITSDIEGDELDQRLGKNVLRHFLCMRFNIQRSGIFQRFVGVEFLIEIKFEPKMRAIQNCMDFITKDHPLTLNRKWR